MSLITVSAGSVGPEYHGEESNLSLRIYCRHAFTTSDLEAIEKGVIGSDLWYKEVAATVVDGVVMYDEFTIDSTTDGTPNSGYYAFVLFNNDGENVGPVYKRIYVPPTPTTTTLGDLAIFSSDPDDVLELTLYQQIINYIDNLISGLTNMATRATTSVFGATRMSFAPAVANTPISVENNDPITRARRKTRHLETYGHDQSGLNTAIALGASPYELLITSSVTVSSDTVIPVNVLVTFEGDGAISVNTGHTLTILNLNPPGPNKRVFTGSGSALVQLPVIHRGWWTGPGGFSHQHAIEQMRDSAALNVGGTVDLGLGPIYCTTILWPSFTRVIGHGNAIDGFDSGEGTIICPPVDLQAMDDAGLTGEGIFSIDRFVFGVTQGFRMNSFENLCLSSGTSGLIIPFLAYGASSGESGLSLQFSNVTFDGSDAPDSSVPRSKIFSTDVGQWECGNILWDHCWWVIPHNSHGHEANTVNNNSQFNSCEFIGGPGIVPIFGDNIGYTELINCEFRGTINTTRTDVVTNSASLNIESAAGNFFPDYVGTTAVLSGGTPSCSFSSIITDVPDENTLTLAEMPPTTSTGVNLALNLRLDVDVSSRTQTNTIITNNGSGFNWLDIVGGAQFTEADIGNKVIRNGTTFYITGLLFVTATGLVSRATLNEEITPDATQRNAVIYTPGPNPAQAYAGVQIDGSHTSMTMRGCVSEGFQYMAVLAGFQLEGPHNFDGCWIQDRILVNGSCEIAFRGNTMPSQILVEGDPAALVLVTSSGDQISKNTKNYGNGLVAPSPIRLDDPQIWKSRTGETSVIQTEDSFPEGRYQSRRELPFGVFDRSTSVTPGTIPMLSAATARLTGVSLPQPLLLIGRLNPYLKTYIDYWYAQGYLYATGATIFWSNVHAAYKRWQFIGTVEASVFKTPDITDPGTITGDTNNWKPWADNVVTKLLNATSDGWYNITGLALPADPGITDFTLPSGNGIECELTYSGSFGVVLKYNSGSSLSANRFQIDDMKDMAVMAGDRVLLRKVTTGWLVSRITIPAPLQLSAIQTFNNTAALANSNLSARVGPGSYLIEVVLQTTSAVKGLKADIAGGTATATLLKGQWTASAPASTAGAAAAALNDPFSNAVLDGVTGQLEFKGSIVVNAAGTIIVRGAQRTADASNTSILPGSTLRITPTRLV